MLTAALQAKSVPAQVAEVGELRRCCSSCGRLPRDIPLVVWRRAGAGPTTACSCQVKREAKSFGVLDLSRNGVAPELTFVTACRDHPMDTSWCFQALSVVRWIHNRIPSF